MRLCNTVHVCRTGITRMCSQHFQMMVTGLLTVLTLLCSPYLIQAEEFSYKVDKSKWVDPHYFGSEKFVKTEGVPKDSDPHVLSCPGQVQCTEKRRHLEAELKDCKQQSQGPDAKPHFMQFVRELTTAVKASQHTSDDTYYIKVHLTSDQLSFLQSLDSLTTSLEPSQLQDATTILVGMLQSVQPCNETETFMDTIQEYTGVHLNFIIQVLTICALALMSVYFISHTKLPLMKLMLLMLGVIFLVSFALTWYGLYMKEVAKRNAEMDKHKDIPLECRPGDVPWTENIKVWVSSWFTISEDKCKKFHELLVVNPILEVPPTKALAVTFTRFIVEPFEHIAEAIKKFFMALTQGLPLPLIVVELASLLVVLFFLSGYSIRVPFLLSIGPREHPIVDAREVRKLTDELHQMRNSLAVKQASEVDTRSHAPSIYFTDVRPNRDTVSQQPRLHQSQIDKDVSSEGAQAAVQDCGSGDPGNVLCQDVINFNTVALNSQYAKVSNSGKLSLVQANGNHDVETVGMKKTT